MVRKEDWDSLGMGLIRSRFSVTTLCVCGGGGSNGLISVEGSKPVAPIISCIAHVGNVFPVTQYSSHGSSVAAQREAPQHKCWHPQSESRDRLV